MTMSGPLLTGYTQVINDYYDREIDAINEPYRPIPSGKITEQEAIIQARRRPPGKSRRGSRPPALITLPPSPTLWRPSSRCCWPADWRWLTSWTCGAAMSSPSSLRWRCDPRWGPSCVQPASPRPGGRVRRHSLGRASAAGSAARCAAAARRVVHQLHLLRAAAEAEAERLGRKLRAGVLLHQVRGYALKPSPRCPPRVPRGCSRAARRAASLPWWAGQSVFGTLTPDICVLTVRRAPSPPPGAGHKRPRTP